MATLIMSTIISCQLNSNETMSSNESTNDVNWRDRLSSEQYRILRDGGTERPFSSPLNEESRQGQYHCAGCGATLYESHQKFDSHCGWPSFDSASGHIRYIEDHSHSMERIEIRCGECDGHLGHVFDDGPTETGLRHCVNGVSLEFAPTDSGTD